MRKRIGAALVAVSLMLVLLATPALAAGPTLTVKTPATIPKAGEEFTVTVEIIGNPGFNAMDLTLAYDKTAVSCESVGLGSVTKGALSASNANAADGAMISLASLSELAGDGPIMVCTFKVLTGGDAGISLKKQMLTDNEGPISCEVTTETVAAPQQVESTPTTSGETSSETPVTKPTTPTTPNPQSGGAAETAKPSFPDVVGHWGEEWIVEAAARGLFAGDDKGSFLPDKSIIRGDFVLVLWRMAGKPEPVAAAPFADVPADAYYAKAVAWAYEKGYVNGKGSGFAPKDSLTRQEAMKILFGYAGGQSGGELLLGGVYDSTFNDSGEIASWAKPAMYWAVYNKIINGMNGGLNPKGEATRVQLAKILVEYQNSMEPTNSQS